MSNVLLIIARVCGTLEVLAQNAVRKSFQFLRVPVCAQLSVHDGLHLTMMDCGFPCFQLKFMITGDTVGAPAVVNYPTTF